MYIYIYLFMCVYIYIYVYIEGCFGPGGLDVHFVVLLALPSWNNGYYISWLILVPPIYENPTKVLGAPLITGD